MEQELPTELASLSEQDLEEVLRLERLSFSDPWSREAFRQEIRQAARGGYSRVLRRGREILAYSVAWFVADEGHLANLAVSPEHRRFGLARRLMDDLISEGERRGAHLLWLEVRVSNEPAIRLYRSYQFRPVSIRKGYYSRGREDALVMCRDVPERGQDAADPHSQSPGRENTSALVHGQEGRTPAAG